MNWIKLHTGIHRNPKVRAAQAECPGAREVFILMLCINGEHEFDGLLPVAYCAPGYLAAELGIDTVTASRCVTVLRDAGLLHEFDDVTGVSFAITGYTDEWMPRRSNTAADRAKRYRKRKKLREVSESAESASRTVTQRRVTRHTASPESHASRGVEESRGEESKRSAPAGAAEPLVLIPTSPSPRFDFESLYARFPRKRSKQEGMDACVRHIRTDADFQRLGKAVDVYAAEVRRLSTPPDKQLHWSTFVNGGRWVEYAEEGERGMGASRPPPELWQMDDWTPRPDGSRE